MRRRHRSPLSRSARTTLGAVAIVSALIAGCADGHRVTQGAPPAKDRRGSSPGPATPVPLSGGVITPTAGSVDASSIQLVYEGSSSEVPRALVVAEDGRIGVLWESPHPLMTDDIRPWCATAELGTPGSPGIRRVVERLRAPTAAELGRGCVAVPARL
jgi:hypothetical protein